MRVSAGDLYILLVAFIQPLTWTCAELGDSYQGRITTSRVRIPPENGQYGVEATVVKEPGLFEGDIMLTTEQKLRLGLTLPRELSTGVNKRDSWRTKKRRRRRRKVTSELTHLWPKATVPYLFDKSIHDYPNVQTYIKNAIDFWEKHTCVRFKEIDAREAATATRDGFNYIRFIVGKGCHSGVGMKAGAGEQTVSIGKGCEYEGMVMHELGHTLGFWHEHARFDRDNHVVILWDNIAENARHNFLKRTNMHLLGPYDLSSLMQYDMWAFGENGKKTLQPILRDMEFITGQRKELSFYDVMTANRMYKCADRCPKSSPVCENEGFLNSKCSCTCPPGLIGSRCQYVIRNARTSHKCGGVINVKNVTEFTSPGYPRHYKNRMRCNWLIEGPPNTTLTLKFLDFDLQKGHNTCRDYLDLRYYRIGIKQGPVLCGDKNISRVYRSASHVMMAHFYSNSFTTRRGFRASVSVQPKTDCYSSPCMNSGTCVQLEFDYFCNCAENWVGHQCEIAVVDGGFSPWSAWDNCVGKCGMQQRNRACDNPAPANGGLHCDGELFQVRRCGDEDLCKDYFYCHFGNSDRCGIEQLGDDDFDWILNKKGTPSLRTGPNHGHTSRDEGDMYIYLEASHAQKYKQAGFLLPEQKTIGLSCLHFFYHMQGANMGTLQVFIRHIDGKSRVIWQLSGNQGSEWQESSVALYLRKGMKIGFMGVRGASFDADIALDDISLSPGYCQRRRIKNDTVTTDAHDSKEKSTPKPGEKTRTNQKSHNESRFSSNIEKTPTKSDEKMNSPDNSGVKQKPAPTKYSPPGCSTGVGRFHSPGPFAYFVDCKRINCFCNQNGKVDCPAWMSETICDDRLI